MHALAAFAVTALIALGTAEVVGRAAVSGTVPQKHARKFLHVAMGPVFMLCWQLFPSDTPLLSGLLAAAIPLAMAIKFALVAFGVLKDEKLLKTASRSGAFVRSLSPGFESCDFLYHRHHT